MSTTRIYIFPPADSNHLSENERDYIRMVNFNSLSSQAEQVGIWVENLSKRGKNEVEALKILTHILKTTIQGLQHHLNRWKLHRKSEESGDQTVSLMTTPGRLTKITRQICEACVEFVRECYTQKELCGIARIQGFIYSRFGINISDTSLSEHLKF